MSGIRKQRLVATVLAYHSVCASSDSFSEDRAELFDALADLRKLAERQSHTIMANQDRLRRLEGDFDELFEAGGRGGNRGGEDSFRAANISADSEGQALQGAGKAGAAHETTRAIWWSSLSPKGKIESMHEAMDHMWLIICGALVMFMQVGFAALEAGTCRRKNVQSILMKNVADACFGALAWFVCGYAFAYGGVVKDMSFGDGNGFIGRGFNVRTDTGISPSHQTRDWFFQWTFCSAAATIVSGGVAERVRFGGFCIFGSIMTAVIYPVVVGSTWGGGWLSEAYADVNFIDFAGSGIVHFTGGVGALVGAIIAGPRVGRWDRPDEFAPHSFPLIVLGTMILWLGWYGFNCGSTLGMHSGHQGAIAAQVAMNMTISAASAAMTVFLLKLKVLQPKTYDVGALCNGILVGHVSITAGCSNVESGSACLIGIVGGLIYLGASSLLQRLHIDDPIDAFAVHGAGGAWGLMAASLFDWGKGFDVVHAAQNFDCIRDETGSCRGNSGAALVLANFTELAFIAGWAGSVSLVVFLMLRVFGLLRTEDAIQLKGLDTEMVQEAYVLPKTYCEHSLYPIDDCSDTSSTCTLTGVNFCLSTIIIPEPAKSAPSSPSRSQA